MERLQLLHRQAVFFALYPMMLGYRLDRIEQGMTEEQVAALLGPPTIKLDYTDSLIWVNGPDAITVNMDAGKVVGKAYNPPTAWQRLRWHFNEWLVRLGIGGESY